MWSIEYLQTNKMSKTPKKYKNERMKNVIFLSLITGTMIISCSGNKNRNNMNANFTGAANEVVLITLDPGHFHAALVQKQMYEQVNPTVYVYAPEGNDVQGHLKKIENFNSRKEDPTNWEQVVYTGPDYLEKMLREKQGNVVIISGNNMKKTEYIRESINAGLNVLADKPMVITPDDFQILLEAFELARKNNVFLYDIMTERYEITTILQKELSTIPELFGQLKNGTTDEPAITKESVHHFFKYVSGNPLTRPAWFFDTAQQGEGLVDISTHLVDLVQWECYPETKLNYQTDAHVMEAKRWPTKLTAAQFKKVTGLNDFPPFLDKDIRNDTLYVYSNGEIIFKIKDRIAKISVIWNFKAPENAGDTHYSIMRGTKCNLEISQGKEENYTPELYVKATNNTGETGKILKEVIENQIQTRYPGISVSDISPNRWKINIPKEYRNGHEAHFAQVTERFLQYLGDGKLPEWEVPNMINKYYITTEALKKVKENN